MAFIEPMHRNKPNITYLLTQATTPCDAGHTDASGVTTRRL